MLLGLLGGKNSLLQITCDRIPNGQNALGGTLQDYVENLVI